MIDAAYSGRLHRRLNGNAGLACDVDNTISITTPSFFRLLDMVFDRLPEDEGLSIEEMVKKYDHSLDVPQWNTEYARKFAEAILRKPSFYDNLPVIDGARQALHRIAGRVPMSAYITARPQEVEESTEAYLRSFPQLPLIIKPGHLGGDRNNVWKAHVLVDLYPRVTGIIDDDFRLVEALPNDYRGVVLLYGQESVPANAPGRVYPCRDWQAVEEKVCELEGVLKSV